MKLLLGQHALRERSAGIVLAPSSETVELLVDAERLFDEGHMNWSSALLEQLTTLFPDGPVYADLRLMEIYHQIQRRDDYEWVSQRLYEQFDSDTIEWAPTPDVFRANLECLAEKFLQLNR